MARAFPSVHQFIVMNECNQPLFLNPPWNTSGANQSAAICGRALVAAYDALPRVSSANFVWGVGLSPRGNDSPSTPSNSSTSPVKFLGYLGAWFKAFAQKTHRSAPLMDGLDFHPYPIPQSLPFAQRYPTSNNASISNLSRIYQAFYLGFNGSPLKTIRQQAGGGLPLSLNEMGIQTDASSQPGYVGVEVSANAAGGVLGDTATESYQANYYGQMLDLLACDPNVRVINIFHLVDEPNLAGWQSGLYWVGTVSPLPKQSASTVQSWIQRTTGNCQGTQAPWTPPGVSIGPATTTTTTTPQTTLTTPTSNKPGATTKTKPPENTLKPPPTIPSPPAGCTGVCASGLRSVAPACIGASASKAKCKQAIAAAQKELAVLQALLRHAKGAAKTTLNAEVAAYKAALSVGNGALKSLEH